MDSSDSVQHYIERLAQEFEQADLFYGHGTDNAFDEAVYLVFVLLGIEFGSTMDLGARLLSDDEKTDLNRAVRRRIDHQVPVAYLVGKAWFAGYPFHIDERALVPRSPIAELINNGFSGLLTTDPGSILDMCTGSGCIGIAAGLQYPEARVDLVDISADCIALANDNIALHSLGQRVKTLQSDGFASVGGSYDLILSNPPYVSESEYQQLPTEYLREPALGLLSEANGLAIPVKLLEQAGKHLNADGILVMEVGFSADALMNLLPQVEFLWLEFEQGGSGVFCLTADQLRSFSETCK